MIRKKADCPADTAYGPKKKMSRGTKILFIIVCVLAVLALLMLLTVMILTLIGRSSLTDDGSRMTLQDREEGDVESLGSGIIRYQGQRYRYNSEVIPILLIGVDAREQSVQENACGSGGQADVNVLAVLDPKNGRITLLAISRDTMCELDALDASGAHIGTAYAQLALAYTYGDGGKRSCELQTAAVSRLLYDVEIPAYASISINGIVELVNAVGGVTVTPETSFSAFTAGQPAELTGWKTEKYLRYREHTTEGNNERMQRQNQVMTALMQKLLQSVKQNPSSALSLYQKVSRNVTTNVNTAMLLYLAQRAASMDFSGGVRTVPGESVLGAQNHAEFHPDSQALFRMLLDIFYEPVTEETAP